MSIILTETGYDRLIADIYSVNTKMLYRLKKGTIYKEYIKAFNDLSEDEKKTIKDRVKREYELEHKRLVRKRENVSSPLTQEQINYILDNKDLKTQTQIGKELNISKDRVNSVIRGVSYKDLILNYYNFH